MNICIVGMGKLGYALANALLGGGNDITILDKDENRISNAGNSMDAFTVLGDALSIDTLRNVNVGACDLIIAATENDETNMVICTFAKKLGCSKAMARVREPQHFRQLSFIKDSLGIDYLLNPDHACANEIYNYLTKKDTIKDNLFTKDGISILEVGIENTPELIGKKLYESRSTLKDILVGAISRNGKIIVPNGSVELIAKDRLYLVSDENTISEFTKTLKTEDKSQPIQRVMIAGGGKTAFFLADMFEKDGIAVKIIEQNESRCKELASSLNSATILCGDASDISVLRDEGLDSIDAFVATTGIDEENLLLSMLVKQYGIKEVVAKVSRTTFVPLMEELGTSVVINPQQIIANNVLSFVRKQGIVLFSKIINGQAEFREISAEISMPLTQKTLAELDIPEGILVISVKHGNNVIIPNGNTQIEAGDKVMLLSLLSSAAELEGLLIKTNSSIL